MQDKASKMDSAPHLCFDGGDRIGKDDGELACRSGECDPGRAHHS